MMILVQRLSTQSSLTFLSIFITNFVFHFHNNPCLGFTINNNFSALPFFLTKHRYCYHQKEEKVSTRRSKAKNNDNEIISTTGTTTAEAFDVNLSTYDFSSKQGWDDFYQQATIHSEEAKVKDDEVKKKESSLFSKNEQIIIKPFEFEWHNSLDTLSILSSLPTPSAVQQGDDDNDDKVLKILLVGNGNSNLPKIIHEHYNDRSDNNGNVYGKVNILALDYSQPCIDMLRKVYDKIYYPHMHFVCGDATKLVDCIQDYYKDKSQSSHSSADNNDEISFDVIIDKGLMDAMMCDEGWNASVERYIEGVSELLQKSKKGKFLLISYKLNQSTKEYLFDIGDKFGLEWDFDIADKSNDRISFTIGRHKVNTKD